MLAMLCAAVVLGGTQWPTIFIFPKYMLQPHRFRLVLSNTATIKGKTAGGWRLVWTMPPNTPSQTIESVNLVLPGGQSYRLETETGKQIPFKKYLKYFIEENKNTLTTEIVVKGMVYPDIGQYLPNYKPISSLSEAEREYYTKSIPKSLEDWDTVSFRAQLSKAGLYIRSDETAAEFALRVAMYFKQYGKYGTDGASGLVKAPETTDLSLRGGCQVLSYQFVATMRANGIPSRTVQGCGMSYMGLSAPVFYSYHVWCEIWSENRWIMVDPSMYTMPNSISYNSKIADPKFGNMPAGGRVIFNYDQEGEYQVDGLTVMDKFIVSPALLPRKDSTYQSVSVKGVFTLLD